MRQVSDILCIDLLTFPGQNFIVHATENENRDIDKNSICVKSLRNPEKTTF